MSRKIKIIIAIIAIIAVAVVAVFGVKKQMDKRDVKIGLIIPLTGPTGYIGDSIKRGIETGMTLYGNGLPIQIDCQDSQGFTKNAINAYQHLITVNNPSIIISGGSSVANTLLPLTEKDKRIHIATAVAAENFPQQGKKSFRLFLRSDIEAKQTAEFCYKTLMASSAVVLYVNDDFGKSYLENFTNTFIAANKKISLSIGFEKGQNDFRNIITKMKSTNFDAIYIISADNLQGFLIKQIRESGVTQPIVTLFTILKEENLSGAGQAIEGVYYVATDFDPLSPHANQKEFVAAYLKKYSNKLPDAYAAFSCDIIHMICNAVKDGNRSSEEIENYLRMNSFMGVMGKVEFDKNGDCAFGISVKRIHLDDLESGKGKVFNVKE